MKASIIILTYKSFDGVGQTIKSVLKQTYEEYEVIISDDGSPNFDRDLIESFYKDTPQFPKFRIVAHKNNVGTVKNFNEAIKQATGDLIVPLSAADEFCDENALCEIIRHFCDNNVNICLGIRILKNNGKSLPTKKQIELMESYGIKKLWLRNAISNMYYGSALYYRKSHMEKNGNFDEDYLLLEDYPFVMKQIFKGEKIHIIKKPTIYYDTSGISNGLLKKKVKQESIPLLKDNSLLFKRLYQEAETFLNSKTGKQYLEYRQHRYESQISKSKCPVRIKIRMIILVAKICRVILKKPVIEEIEYRFMMIWWIEELVTRLKAKNTITTH